MKKCSLGFAFLITFVAAMVVSAQDFGDGYYRFTTQWLGDARSLDVANDGVNDKVILAKTNSVTGQNWKITPLGNGFYRLTTEWLGETLALDVVNDGKNNRLRMAPTANASGQFWKITRQPSGYFRLTTKWFGDSRSLDVVNDGTNDKLQLAPSGETEGQFWRILPVDKPGKPVDNSMTRQTVDGYTLVIRTARLRDPETIAGVERVTTKLAEIKKLLSAEQFDRLRKVPIWFEYKRIDDGAVWYHTSAEWLVSQGYPAELEKSIEISNLKNFLNWQTVDQPMMLLHELAHAYEDLYLTDMRPEIERVYNKANASGKYESVDYVRGGQTRHYAMNNATEYFAELTESYFGRNDYFPFNREELRTFDPEGFKLIEKAWK